MTKRIDVDAQRAFQFLWGAYAGSLIAGGRTVEHVRMVLESNDPAVSLGENPYLPEILRARDVACANLDSLAETIRTFLDKLPPLPPDAGVSAIRIHAAQALDAMRKEMEE